MMLWKNYAHIRMFSIGCLILACVTCFGVWLFFLFWHDTKPWTIVALIDVSHSMNTRDIQTPEWIMSRLDVVKKMLPDMVAAQPGVARWAIIFSQRASYYVPPTINSWLFLDYIDAMHTSMLPWWWTNIWQALDLFALNAQPADIALLFTDWGDIALSWNRVPFDMYVLWLWSEKWASVRYPDGTVLLENWIPVLSIVDPAIIQSIDPWAQTTILDSYTQGAISLPFSMRYYVSSYMQYILLFCGVCVLLWLLL